MRFYLAAQYARREELRAYAAELAKIGIESTAHWLDETSPLNGTLSNHSADHTTWLADRDIADIERADALVLFTNGSETKIVRGAHHFEAGYAYGRGKRVITVGPRDNVFYYLPCIPNYPTWAEAFEQFKLERIREEENLGY